MLSESNSARSRARIRAELWSWSAWLMLAIISYPALVAARLSPWAGLVGGIAAGTFLVARAGLGYAAKRDLDAWQRALLISAAAAAGTCLTATTGDGSDPMVALVVSGVTFAEILFTWHFLPAIVRDAETTESNIGRHFQLLPWVGRGGTLVRPSLGLALLLGFLAFGAGALWQRAETWALNPAPWFIGVTLLALGVMFVERISFFERSAREGNLEIPLGSFARWTAAALLLLLIAGLLGSVGPRRSAAEVDRSRIVGSAGVQRFSGGLGTSSEGGASVGLTVLQEMLAAAGGSRRQPMLSLLLLLLLILLILLLLFSRSRAVRWLSAVIAAALTRLAKAWRRAVVSVRRWFSRKQDRAEVGEQFKPANMPDPLFDLFDYPELVGRLSPREVLIRTYHLLLNFAEMVGHGRRAGETPFEYARELEAEAPAARDGLRALTWGYAGAMYGGSDTALPDPSAVRMAWRQAVEALRGELSPEDFELQRRAYLAARQLEWASRH